MTTGRRARNTSALPACVEERVVASNTANALTVDVEDYFHAQALESQFPRSNWDLLPSRVEANTDRILSLFDDHKVKATFFTLGWVAECHGSLVRKIVDNGHELASHGYEHIRADRQNRSEFRADVRKSKEILEDLSGSPVLGYRAATFSIGKKNMWALDILAEEGYRYSSSIYPIRHDYYGMPEAPRFPFRPVDNNDFLEIPISTVRIAGCNLPCGGGGYFRLLPYAFSKRSIARINRRERQPSLLYFHPWEIDPGQPRPRQLGFRTRIRHYTNLSRMEGRLRRALSDFLWDRMDNIFLAPETA